MKRLIYSALLIGLFLFASTSKSQAEVYLGEFCWQVDITDESALMKLGVYQKEGGHYTLYGTLNFDPDPPTDAFSMHGNAEIVGSNVKLTLVSSNDDSNGVINVFSEVSNAVLALSNLNGTIHIMGMENKGGAISTYHDQGMMTFVACP